MSAIVWLMCENYLFYER